MSSWLIALIGMSVLSLAALWFFTIQWAKNKIRGKFLVTILIGLVILVSVVVVPIQQITASSNKKATAEATAVLQSFNTKYTNTTLLQVTKPPDVYFTFRTENGSDITVSIYCKSLFGDNWVDLGQLNK